MKAFKKSILAAGVILASAGVAQAATVDPGVGTYTFSGPATLSGLGLSPMCTLSLTGDVQKTGDGGVTVTVTDGSATGGFLSGCGAVGLEFPWKATIPASDIPSDPTQAVPVLFTNVVVTAAGTQCTDEPANVPAMFTNGDPISESSSFTFNANVGDCAVMGTVEAENDVNVTQ